MSINKCFLTGRLTREPELRSTASGMAVLGFGVAVNDRRKNNQTGEWEDYPNFIDCTMFGNRAESISRFLSKGSKVAIEGRLHYSKWESKDGDKRSKIEVIVDEIEFLSRSDGGSSNGSTYDYGDETGSCRPQSASRQPQASVYDDDIPF